MHDSGIIYAQVLLLDNKIEGWKICQSQKRSPYDFKAYWKQGRMKDYTMETFVFNDTETCVEDGWRFNPYVYEVLGPKWINEWEYADDYKGSKAVSKTLNEVAVEMEELKNVLGGRFEFVSQLGKN